MKLELIFQVIFHCIVCTACIVCLAISFSIPWVKANIEIGDSYFQFRVPIELGLTKCYSDICDDYNHAIKTINMSPNLESNFTTGSLFNDTSQSSTSTSSDGDAGDTFHLPFKIPPIALPPVSIPPIDLPDPPSPPKNLLPDYKGAVRQAQVPFKHAATAAIILLDLAGIFLLTSIVMALYFMYTGIISRSVLHSVLLICAMLCMFLAVTFYVVLTYQFIHGGYYIDGLWLCSYCCLAGLFSCLISMVWMNASRAFYYTPIIDTTLAGTVADGNDSVGPLDTLQRREEAEEVLFAQSICNSRSLDSDSGVSAAQTMRYIQLTATSRMCCSEHSDLEAALPLKTVRPRTDSGNNISTGIGTSSSGRGGSGNANVGIGYEGGASEMQPLITGIATGGSDSTSRFNSTSSYNSTSNTNHKLNNSGGSGESGVGGSGRAAGGVKDKKMSAAINSNSNSSGNSTSTRNSNRSQRPPTSPLRGAVVSKSQTNDP